MRTTTIFAETHTSERANLVAYRLVLLVISLLVTLLYLVTCVNNVYLNERRPTLLAKISIK